MKGIFDSDCVDGNWARLTLEEINKKDEFLTFLKGNDRIYDLTQKLKRFLGERENALDVLYKRYGKF